MYKIVRSCLIISPHFPPSTLAGVHRARHLAKHLPTYGWRAKVICVDPRHHVERLDPELAELVPKHVGIVQVGALPVLLTRPFGIAGDLGLRSLLHIRAAIVREMQSAKPDVVMITGSPYYPMLLASEVKRRFSVPVVLDFQDPWVSAWGATHSRWSKAGLSHFLAKVLEPKVIRAADFITSVSETQNSELRARYPWLDAQRMAAIPIGGDPMDFNALSSYSVSEDNPVKWPSGQKTLAFVGTFMPRTKPVMEQFLKAFAMSRNKTSGRMDNVRLLFVGTSNQPNDTNTYRVLPLAHAAGLKTGVEEIPQRLPFLEAITVLARSDGVLLIGSDEPHYTASKIYPGLMSGRPFLSLFHRASSAHAVLARAGGGIALTFATTEELVGMRAIISEAIVKLVTNPGSFGQADPTAYEAVSAKSIAMQFADIFARLPVPAPQAT